MLRMQQVVTCVYAACRLLTSNGSCLHDMLYNAKWYGVY